MFIERRRAKRIKKHVEVQYREPAGKGHWYMAEVKNLSEGGLLVISTPKALEVNTILRLRIKLPEYPSKWFEFDGRAVACDKDAALASLDSKITFYLARIEITKIELLTKDMIRQFIDWHLSSGI